MNKQPNEVWEEVCIESFKEMLDNTYPEKVSRNKQLIEKIMLSTGNYMKSILNEIRQEKSV